LPLPDPVASPTLDDLASTDAIRLFVQRAQGVHLDFALTASNAATIATICQRLDGVPLAIELAAARLRHFSLEALVIRMDRRLPLLTGGARDLPARLQTMGDAIAWSYDLLDNVEQSLFRRLAVFVGGFTIAAAAVVCDADDLGVLEGIGLLIDKNLVRDEGAASGDQRYGMLETIREFGRERLAASGREEVVRRRHAEWCLSLAERAAPGAKESGRAAWIARLEAEHDNLRVALAWLLDRGQAALTVRLVATL
jgi:predicted ATPase